MLPLDKYLPLITEWAKKKQWGMMRASASKRLEAMGYVDLGLGSWYRYMHKDWFEKAKQEGLLVKKNDMWIPFVEIEVNHEVIGMRGKTPIYDKKKEKSKISQASMDKLDEFDKRYKKWLYGKEQTSMHFDRLVDAYEKEITDGVSV
jgi:hypothetical protein